MFETLSILPISFWVVVALLVGGTIAGLRRAEQGIGLPMLAVLGTVAAWYVGDAFYNDYANNHAVLFDSTTLSGAWWQVAWFLVVFLAAVPEIHRAMNAPVSFRRSGVMQLVQNGVADAAIQKQLAALLTGCVAAWTGLAIIALLFLRQEFIYYLFPFLGYKATPWTHGRVGAGFDALSVVAIYLQLLSSSMFGVVAALSTHPRVRRMAVIFCLLSWSYFIFDRARNIMLALVIPGLMCWVFLRMRGSLFKKAAILFGCFLLVNAWMKFVIANRDTMSISGAFSQKGLVVNKQQHNEGLNMFEELCWVSTFIDDGSYRPNWGARYFAELVNPIPRALWPGKPMIGLDYAKARGHAQDDDNDGGVNTTISTGLIGQGVVNFGRLLGPAAAALLMALWVTWLARLDLNIQALGRLPLYSLGMILTFNLGRDITLITLYPFVFGSLLVWAMDHYLSTAAPSSVPASHGPEPKVASSSVPSLFAPRVVSGGFVKRPGLNRHAP